jgi:GH15 family glucan-1,4-alpha-glucosidase
MAYKGIGEYGVIGNGHTAALVGTDASIDWCCMPHFDSPSVFAAILDDKIGGRFHIKPQPPFTSQQAYIPNTNVLQTTFHTGTGTVTVTDFMPCYRAPNQRMVRFHEIHRLVECTGGTIALELLFEPKMNYSVSITRLTPLKYGIVASVDSEDIALSSPLPFTIEGGKAVGIFTLGHGQKVTFVLRYNSDRPLSPLVYNSAGKLERTAAYWRQQADGCTFSGPWGEAITRSYLALHLLVYLPTGAMIAAPTTSLPEQIGGGRNWDYRFIWLRDASLTINAFAHLGHKEEAVTFMKWLMTVCGRCGPKAQILYDINFKDPISEQVLEHLEGYRNSPPVRIGNAAYNQLQLDVFGEVLEAANSYLTIGGHISNRTWGLLQDFVNAACENWPQPDSGIWEVRSGRYHFVHSKLLCWVAIDRGIKMATKLGRLRYIERWRKNLQMIRDDILNRGWNPERKAFTQHYDTTALDASNLLIPLYDFLPVSDERIMSTIDLTVKELSLNGLLRRYNTSDTDDGISGEEGAFLWCSFWLVRNFIRLGRLEEAKALYQRLLDCGNHLGLFSEMVDPVSGEALGNFPQALTHLAVIVTGLELTQALESGKIWV